MTDNELLLAFHTKLQEIVPDAAAREGILLDLSLFARNTRAAQEPFLDPAGVTEIKAFTEAAVALTPLGEEMRDRVLSALSGLLLPAPPDFLTRLAPALESAAAAVMAQYASRPAEEPASPTHADIDAQVAAANAGLKTLLERGTVALVKNDDGTFKFVPTA